MAQWIHQRYVDYGRPLFAAELVSPHAGSFAVPRALADTAVAVGLAAIAVERDLRLGGLGQANYDRLRRSVGAFAYHGEVTQREFWRFHDLLHLGLPRIVTTNADAMLAQTLAIAAAPHHGQARTEIWASAKTRAVIFETLLDLFRDENADDTLTLSDLQDAVARYLNRSTIVRIRFAASRTAPFAAPATHQWVHSFMLWTGISPPAVVTTEEGLQPTAITPMLRGGRNVQNSRSHTRCHRRRHFNRRPSQEDRICHLPHRAAAARVPFPERRERVRLAAQRYAGPFGGPGHGKMVHQFRDDRQRRA